MINISLNNLKPWHNDFCLYLCTFLVIANLFHSVLIANISGKTKPAAGGQDEAHLLVSAVPI